MKLCGLNPNELATVFENNPRAYMAMKGAVAEEHLKKYLTSMQSSELISDFNDASGDFDKDFYVKTNKGKNIVIECKNAEVSKLTTKRDFLEYFSYLQKSEGTYQGEDFTGSKDFTGAQLKDLYKRLPQQFRESGIPRYEFSASKLKFKSVKTTSDKIFIDQFDDSKLTVDFQRTRNSNNKIASKNDPKTNRFYTLNELDIVAVCLFSRSMKWEFLFASANNLLVHEKYATHYSNRLVINSQKWTSNLSEIL